MHFKSAVILCAVYFFTSVWSTGLNKEQIKSCIFLYKHPIYIPTTMKEDFGIERPDHVFNWNLCIDLHKNVKNLLLALAYEGKNYNPEVPTLTAFEVDYYVKKFIKRSEVLNQLGWLLREDIIDFYAYLNIKGKQLSKAIELIPWAAEEGGVATAVEFLLTMIDILPEGNGLNQNQIKEFIELYTSGITDSGRIDPLEVKQIFNGFGMPIEPREELFEYYRPAAIELMELMIVTAERSTTVHENEIVLSTQEVRTLIAGFKRYDTDNDGLLYDGQAKKFLEESLTNNPQSSRTINFGEIFSNFLLIFDFSSKKKNIAEFLFVYITNKTTDE